MQNNLLHRWKELQLGADHLASVNFFHYRYPLVEVQFFTNLLLNKKKAIEIALHQPSIMYNIFMFLVFEILKLDNPCINERKYSSHQVENPQLK